MSAAYFDDPGKQYQENLINNPPVHVATEIESLIKKIGKERMVTDFGSGTGRLTIPLLKKGYIVAAVDVSRKSLSKLKNITTKYRLKGLTCKTGIRKSKIITGCDVLHHVDISKFFDIFYRNLDKGGKIVFSEPNAGNIFWYLLIWTRLDWGEEKGIIKVNFWNIKRQLKVAGFNKIEITGMGILPGPFCFNNRELCRFNYWLGNLPILKLFSYRLLIFAGKD